MGGFMRQSTLLSAALVGLLALTCAACGEAEVVTSKLKDVAGSPADVVGDVAELDGAAADAGPDSTSVDDVGPQDAGQADSSPIDVGAEDAGFDAGSPDAAAIDAAEPDAGPPAEPPLCNPCSDSSQCEWAGGLDSLCVDLGAKGAFCGSTCLSDDMCPPQYSCEAVSSIEGKSGKQCQPKGSDGAVGECGCSPAAVAKSMSTVCYNEVFEGGQLVGKCTGKRSCSAAGLSACDAGVPAPETCDGLDNDCDGGVDEGLCDDKQPCTLDTCKGKACENTPHSGPCDDGDPCTEAANCSSGTCHGKPKSCDDGDTCTADFCTAGIGCKSTPIPGCSKCKSNKDCDDGKGCTDDFCNTVSGACFTKPKICDDGDSCTTDSCSDVTGECDSVMGKDCQGIMKLPFAASFACGSKSNAIWTLDPPAVGGPGWAIDNTPAVPKAPTGSCALNFNNGVNFACPAGAKGVSGNAVSPWIDGTGLPTKANMRFVFTRAGLWEKNNDDELHVQYTLDDKTWTTLYDVTPLGNINSWATTTLSMNQIKGKLFRFRFRFFSVDCDDNSGTGPFIDKVSLTDIA